MYHILQTVRFNVNELSLNGLCSYVKWINTFGVGLFLPLRRA